MTNRSAFEDLAVFFATTADWTDHHPVPLPKPDSTARHF